MKRFFPFRRLVAMVALGAMATFVGCSDYDDDINNLNGRLDALEEGSIADLESQYASLKTTVEDIQKFADSESEKLAALTAKVEEQIEGIEAEIAENKADIADINAEIADLSSDVEANADLIESLQADLGDLEKRVKANEDAIAALQTTVATNIGLIQDLEEGALALKEQVETNEYWIDENREAIEENRNEIQTLKDITSDLNEAVTNLGSRIGAAEGAIDVIEATMTQIQEDLEAGLADKQTQIDKINNVTIPALEARIEANEGNIEANKAAIAALEARVNTLESDMETIKYNQEMHAKAIVDLMLIAESLDSRLTDLNDAFAKWQGEYMERYWKTLFSLNEDSKEWKSFYTLIDEAVVYAATHEGTVLNEMKVALENKLAEIEKAIEDLQAKDEEMQESIDAIEAFLEGQVGAAIKQIQSITYVPEYLDGMITGKPFAFVNLAAGSNGSKDDMDISISDKMVATAEYDIRPVSLFEGEEPVLTEAVLKAMLIANTTNLKISRATETVTPEVYDVEIVKNGRIKVTYNLPTTVVTDVEIGKAIYMMITENSQWTGYDQIIKTLYSWFSPDYGPTYISFAPSTTPDEPVMPSVEELLAVALEATDGTTSIMSAYTPVAEVCSLESLVFPCLYDTKQDKVYEKEQDIVNFEYTDTEAKVWLDGVEGRYAQINENEDELSFDYYTAAEISEKLGINVAEPTRKSRTDFEDVEDFTVYPFSDYSAWGFWGNVEDPESKFAFAGDDMCSVSVADNTTASVGAFVRGLVDYTFADGMVISPIAFSRIMTATFDSYIDVDAEGVVSEDAQDVLWDFSLFLNDEDKAPEILSITIPADTKVVLDERDDQNRTVADIFGFDNVDGDDTAITWELVASPVAVQRIASTSVEIQDDGDVVVNLEGEVDNSPLSFYNAMFNGEEATSEIIVNCLIERNNIIANENITFAFRTVRPEPITVTKTDVTIPFKAAAVGSTEPFYTASVNFKKDAYNAYDGYADAKYDMEAFFGSYENFVTFLDEYTSTSTETAPVKYSDFTTSRSENNSRTFFDVNDNNQVMIDLSLAVADFTVSDQTFDFSGRKTINKEAIKENLFPANGEFYVEFNMPAVTVSNFAKNFTIRTVEGRFTTEGAAEGYFLTEAFGLYNNELGKGVYTTDAPVSFDTELLDLSSCFETSLPSKANVAFDFEYKANADRNKESLPNLANAAGVPYGSAIDGHLFKFENRAPVYVRLKGVSYYGIAIAEASEQIEDILSNNDKEFQVGIGEMPINYSTLDPVSVPVNTSTVAQYFYFNEWLNLADRREVELFSDDKNNPFVTFDNSGVAADVVYPGLTYSVELSDDAARTEDYIKYADLIKQIFVVTKTKKTFHKYNEKTGVFDYHVDEPVNTGFKVVENANIQVYDDITIPFDVTVEDVWGTRTIPFDVVIKATK